MDSDSDQRSGREHKKRAPTALTVECGVCAGPAPDHIHFGARCCYSCRAFFRRRAQRSEDTRCRLSAGACDISLASKKCIACRYNKCIAIGMDPALVQGVRRKKHFKRGSDAADDDDDDEDEKEEEEDDSDQMAPRLAKRKRRESEAVTLGGFSNFPPPTRTFSESSHHDGQTPEFKSSEGSPNLRINQTATDYGSPTLSPRIQTTQTSSVFGIERKPFDLMAPHGSGDSTGMSFGYNSGFSAKSGAEYLRPGETAARHLLHHQTSHQPVYFPDQASGSPYTENKFHYYGDRSQPQPPHHHYHPGHVTGHVSGHVSGHVAAHRRPSVIMRAGKEDSSKLQLQADILKFHGNILTHTGNLFNYHANLLNSQKQIEETKPRVEVKQEAEDTGFPSVKIKNESDPATVKAENSPPENDDIFDIDIADQVFDEAQELLFNSPWILRESPQLNNFVQSSSETEKGKILDWLQSPDTSESQASTSQGQQTSVIQEYPQQNCQMF